MIKGFVLQSKIDKGAKPIEQPASVRPPDQVKRYGKGVPRSVHYFFIFTMSAFAGSRGFAPGQFTIGGGGEDPGKRTPMNPRSTLRASSIQRTLTSDEKWSTSSTVQISNLSSS